MNVINHRKNIFLMTVFITLIYLIMRKFQKAILPNKVYKIIITENFIIK